jgi:hypothetical protein
MGLKQERGFLPPFQGFKIMWVIDPGRRSCSRLRTLRRGKRFALGYFLSGFQPFSLAKIHAIHVKHPCLAVFIRGLNFRYGEFRRPR